MFYNVLKAEDIVEFENEKFEHKTLLENDNSSVNIVAIKKDEIIDTHTSISDALVYVFEGKIELHFDAQKFTLNKGEILMFKKMRSIKFWRLRIQSFL